jgi:prepilin-type N-terminal cleavage/methylation domain-containing protein/prepilin-type processing-associated H-X9-DG protein
MFRDHSSKGDRRIERGFTLIELLVVIAIIAILAAVLFPVFSRARENARIRVCASNLGQLGKAIKMYCNDSEGCFPAASCDGNYHSMGRRSIRVLLDPYVTDKDVFRCPSDIYYYKDAYAGLTYRYWFELGGGDWNNSAGQAPQQDCGPIRMTLWGAAGDANYHQANMALVPLMHDGYLYWNSDTRYIPYIKPHMDPGFLLDVKTGKPVTDSSGNLIRNPGGGENVLFCDGHVQKMHKPFNPYEWIAENP